MNFWRHRSLCYMKTAADSVNGPTNGWTNGTFQGYCWQTWDLLGSCIMALRTYVLISLLLTLGTQYIQYVSMVVQLRLSLARWSMPPQVNYHHWIARGAVIIRGRVYMASWGITVEIIEMHHSLYENLIWNVDHATERSSNCSLY